MTGAALRPRTTSEIVDAGFQLTRENFAPLAILATVITIPGLVVALVSAHIAPPGAATPAALGNKLLTLSPLLVVSGCWFFVGIGALMMSSSAAYHGHAVEPGLALRAAFKRAPSLIGGNLLAYLATFVMFIAGAALSAVVILIAGVAISVMLGKVAPGIARTALVILSTVGIMAGGLAGMFLGAARYVNVTATVMLENQSAYSSLKRSTELANGHKRRIVGLLALGFAILAVVVIGSALAVQIVMGNPVVVNVISSLVWIVLYPLAANILTVLYYDLRIRKEGYDIEELSRRLGADAG